MFAVAWASTLQASGKWLHEAVACRNHPKSNVGRWLAWQCTTRGATWKAIFCHNLQHSHMKWETWEVRNCSIWRPLSWTYAVIDLSLGAILRIPNRLCNTVLSLLERSSSSLQCEIKLGHLLWLLPSCVLVIMGSESFTAVCLKQFWPLSLTGWPLGCLFIAQLN